MKRIDWLTGLRTVMRPARRRGRADAASGRPGNRQPSFEVLEDRRLLAITVNTLVDELDGSIIDGDISLRDAIAAAPAAETINFQASLSGGVVGLRLGELRIGRSVTIDATELAGGLTIDASGNDPTPSVNQGDGTRIMQLDDDTPGNQYVVLRGLTLTGGDVTGNGGAILARDTLILENCNVQGNAASGDGGGIWSSFVNFSQPHIAASTISGNTAGGRGGGVYINAQNLAESTVVDSTISGNIAGSDAGGAYLRTTGGAKASMIQSTVSGNRANWRGGGVFAYAAANNTTTIFQSTITLNTADADANNPTIENGGGVFANGLGTVSIRNTIVAANVNPGNFAPDLRKAVTTLSTGYNLIGTNAGSGLAPAPYYAPDANGNVVGGSGTDVIDPGLAPLTNNGGRTETHALLPNSVAINRGFGGGGPGSAYDQRGEPFRRLQRGAGLSARLDIGAFELADLPINPMVVDSSVDEIDLNLSKGQVSLREALYLGAHVVIDPILAGKTMKLNLGEIVIDRIGAVIDGSALPERFIIDAQGKSAIFRIECSSTIGGLAITGGNNGGIRVQRGSRTYSGAVGIGDCLIEGNSGGGIVANNVPLTVSVTRSTIRNNRDGPGIDARNTNVTVGDSFIVDNNNDGILVTEFGSVEIGRSTISGNIGDGIRCPDGKRRVTVETSTIANNQGRGFFSGPASAYANVTFIDSTIANNESAGIEVQHSGLLTITNSTISNNHHRGVYIHGNTETNVIRHSTITGNQGERGAGVYSGNRFVQVRNSIISGNVDTTGFENDVYSRANLYFSIVGRDNIANPQFKPQNIVGSVVGTNENPADPMLGPLADNAGPTLTHMLLPGSIAINAGDPALSAGSGTTPKFDQRGVGFGRVAGGRIDIGAIEAGSVPNNTPPIITTPPAVNSPENSAAVLTLAATDPDVPPQTLTFSITGGADAAKFEISSSGLLSFKVAPDYEIPSDANGDRVYLVIVRVDDSSGAFATKDLSITVTAVNDNNPTFLSPTAINIPENVSLVLPVTAVDADLPVQAITYSVVGGADQIRFDISPGGVLSFKQAPNFEAPADANGDNVYVVTVQANDGAGGLANQTIAVTVTPTNDNSPVFITPANVPAAENFTPVLTVLASDADLPPQSITYSIVGGIDAAWFNITPAGVLAFTTPPDREAPNDANGDNVYVVVVQASDGQGRVATQTLSVTVNGPRDYGDAPDSGPGAGRGNYHTVGADDGPSHDVTPSLRIGATVDADSGQAQSAAGNADDIKIQSPDDEDGLANVPADLTLTVGAQPSVSVHVTNFSGSAATLYGWIDYNADGIFDNATERAAVAVAEGTANGLVSLVFPAVPSGFVGTTFARFRLSTDVAAANPTGHALDGEVEDYRATILLPSGDPARSVRITHNANGGPAILIGSQFGESVAALGDLDGDGVVDLAVGAMRDVTDGSQRPGIVHILLMNADGTVKADKKISRTLGGGPAGGDDDRFGRSVAALGDIDGDGVVDLGVGADLADAAYVVFLKPDGTAKGSQRIAAGVGGGPNVAHGDYFGIAAAGLGDLDGDGINDMAVGSFQDDAGGSNRGAIYVLMLNANGTVKASQKIADGVAGGPALGNDDLFGRSIASLGDLDGDGVTDIAVGGVRDDTGGTDRGAVHILFLNANGTVKARQKIAHATGGGPSLADGDQFGFSVAALGDLDGDGVVDLGVGANYDDAGGLNRGALYVLNLRTDGTARDFHKIASGTGGGPPNVGDSFGSAVAALGDLDGDGFMDLAVGAELDPPTPGGHPGAVHILFLQAAAIPGDFDGDGLVAAGDLGVWRSQFGAAPGPGATPGDADQDLDVDGNDFLAWQRNLGRGPAASASAAPQAAMLESTMPESPTLLLSAEDDGPSSLVTEDSPTSVVWLAAAGVAARERTAAEPIHAVEMRDPATARPSVALVGDFQRAWARRVAQLTEANKAGTTHARSFAKDIDAVFDDETMSLGRYFSSL